MMVSKTTSNCSNCLRLQKENTRLKELLAAQNISWDAKKPTAENSPAAVEKPVHQYSPEEKIVLFRRLFCGRTDVYPVRWESKKGGAGYSPACGNEWRSGVCGKPRVKCGVCKQRRLLPVTDRVIYNHLSGQHTIGVYPLLNDDRCYFLATDFDESSWRDDALAFMQSCKELDIPAALEISRSGQGAHTWIFFSEAVSATEARKLGAALISYTCSRTRQLSLDSYDRFFPNQDTLPRGGFGNLIALPLQKDPREKG
ncbi:MAG: DEAD/DEAH box helicase, partial [Thermodesulfobacteriota bacterium]|nr:DEAD/DEAH box helicase [Thermodesulfobacteriota bacterium]